MIGKSLRFLQSRSEDLRRRNATGLSGSPSIIRTSLYIHGIEEIDDTRVLCWSWWRDRRL